MDETSTIDDTQSASHDASTELIEDELLVEEISIDGMCGVY
jgi:mycofactocin precursor